MGSIKLIFGISVIVISLYLCVELIPPYYSNYEFQDSLQTEALMSANNSKPEDAIRETVFKRAQELGIPLTRDGIIVHRVGTNGSGSVTITAPYIVHISMPGYPMDLHFDPSVVDRGANN